MTCFCIEISGVPHFDFEGVVESFSFENLGARISLYQDLASVLEDFARSDELYGLLSVFNKFGSRLEYVDVSQISRDLEDIVFETNELRSKMPNLLELSFRNMTTIGRLQEKLAKSQLKDGRDFGPSASSLAITSLLPNAVVSWNENARRRCGLRNSSSRFDEFLRRVQEMGRCFERQIPMNSEFARSLEELGGPRALAPAIDLLLLTAN